MGGGYGLAALSGLGQAFPKLAEGMIAGQKLDQHQQQLDELAGFRKDQNEARYTDLGPLMAQLGLQTGTPIGKVPTAAADTVLKTLAAQQQKKQDTARAMEQGAGLAADLEGNHGRVVPLPGEGYGPIKPVLDDPFIKDVVSGLRRLGATDKTMGAYDNAVKYSQDNAQKRGDREQGMGMLERWGLIPPRSGAAPQAAAPPMSPTDGPDTAMPPSPPPSAPAAPRSPFSSLVPEIGFDPTGGKIDMKFKAPTDERDMRALALYDKPFRSLTMGERQQVEKEIETGRVRVSAAQGQNAAEMHLDQPIPPQELSSLRHPATGQMPPPGTTRRQANAGGYIYAPEKERSAVADLQNTKAILSSVSQLSERIITAETPADAALQGARLHAESVAGTNSVARVYEHSRQAFLGVISRTLGGEKGVLTDRDIARIDKMLPSFFDTKQVRDMKIGLVNNLLETAIESKQALMSGQPMSSDAPARIQGLLSQLESAGGGTGARPPGPGPRGPSSPPPGFRPVTK